MNKIIKCCIFTLIISLLFTISACETKDYKEIEEVCYKINSIVKDKEFFIAKIKERRIVLYDNKYAQMSELPLEHYNKGVDKIISIRKDGANVYFIIGGSVDDENGIVFINNELNAVLDGINSIKRIGGNSYWYGSTR